MSNQNFSTQIGTRVWHVRMRNGPKGEDLADEGYRGNYIGINCQIKDPSFDASDTTDFNLQRFEEWNKWSQKHQLTQFARLTQNDLILLSKRDSRFLYVGFATDDPPYLEAERVPLRFRKKVSWLGFRYARENLRGFGYFGLSSITSKRKLDEYADYIRHNQPIQVKQIMYSLATKDSAANEVIERFEVLSPSYFEDLVRFIAEQQGFQVDYSQPEKSNDGGIDLRGWRNRELFDSSNRVEKFSIQIKRRKIGRVDVETFRENILSDEVGYLVSSMKSDIKKRHPRLFLDDKVRLIDADDLAALVLQFEEKLPVHLAGIFRIVRLETTI
ncbi:MAG: restriction endonuclease [Nitrososphaerales archaeon]